MVVQRRGLHRQRKGCMTLMMLWMNSGMHPVSKYTARLHPTNTQRNNWHARRWKAQQQCPHIQKSITPSDQRRQVLWRLKAGQISGIGLDLSVWLQGLGGVSNEWERRCNHLTTISSHLVMVNDHLINRVRGALQPVQLILISLTLSKSVWCSQDPFFTHVSTVYIESLQVFPD